MTSVMLWGRIGFAEKPIRGLRTIAITRAAIPALMWMAVPPAKSIAFSVFAIQPPWVRMLPSASLPSNAKTQWAAGK